MDGPIGSDSCSNLLERYVQSHSLALKSDLAPGLASSDPFPSRPRCFKVPVPLCSASQGHKTCMLQAGGNLWTQRQHLVIRKGPIAAYACTQGLRDIKLCPLEPLGFSSRLLWDLTESHKPLVAHSTSEEEKVQMSAPQNC